MGKQYALGLPRGSVRGIIALVLTAGFIILFVIGATDGLSTDDFLKVIAPYAGIYGIIVNSYFLNRAQQDKDDPLAPNDQAKEVPPTDTGPPMGE